MMTGQKAVTENGRTRNVGPSLSRQGSFVLSQRHQGIHETLRYGILFDIDQARAVSSYDRFLTTEVAPRITDSATVFIRGRTDVVAPTDYNLTLSKGRAEGVWKLLSGKAAIDGKRGVRFEPSWAGEDQKQAPFMNVTPEERNYNRTVIIDVVPQ
jgi:outer membrane protein OmpA-like peptidoglycan-associated protein